MILAQLVVATRWETPYDLTRNTISDLGVVRCTTTDTGNGIVEVCSPWHAGMNVSFVVIGSLLAIGAVLAAGTVVPASRSRVGGVAMALLFVAGVSSAAVGFVPLDINGELHALVATPVFVTQPIALVLLGVVALRRSRVRLGSVLLACGVVAAFGGIAFATTLATGDVGGFYERVALWPCQVGVAALGWDVLRTRRHLVWDTEA